MPDFVRVTIDPNTDVYFQAADSSDLVALHGGPADIADVTHAGARLEGMAATVAKMGRTFIDSAQPDELTVEVSIGIAGEVGWFFAKSAMEGGLGVTLTWKRTGTEQ